MLVLAKVALGMCATLALAGAYVFHEGVIQVDVDETHGSHVHFWVPATVVPLGLRVVPGNKLEEAACKVRPYLPVLREVAKELRKYPNADLVDVRDDDQHIKINVRDGKVYIDAVQKDKNVHVSFPAETISDVADRLESVAPGV